MSKPKEGSKSSVYELPKYVKSNKVLSVQLYSVDFEVFGKVQGVFFRKYTQEKSKEIGLRGWVMNTTEGTVLGQLEGTESKLKIMKEWLQKTGSPKSIIRNADFTNEKKIVKYSFNDFHIRTAKDLATGCDFKTDSKGQILSGSKAQIKSGSKSQVITESKGQVKTESKGPDKKASAK